MKKAISMFLALILLLCGIGSAFRVGAAELPPSLCPEIPFTDVPADSAYYDAVIFVYDSGMMRGTTETGFAPQAFLTRGMFVTTLHRAEWYVPVSGDSTRFIDVSRARYYYAAVLWATKNSITKGKSETRFDPNGLITREQLVTMVYRYVCSKGLQGESELSEKPAAKDDDQISPWAREAMDWAYQRNILPAETAEDGGVLLDPGRYANRGDTALILTNALKPLGIPDQGMDGDSRSNSRAAYADLTDAEFANFRAVNTTGMAKNRLYRSSYPLTNYLRRHSYAMIATENAGIRTILNFAETEEKAKERKNYEGSYYAEQNVAYCYTPVRFLSEEFRTAFRDALRYMASHEGPYLIHCMEGKDRAGVTSAILECLMGASYSEVYSDFVKSHENYYFVIHGTQHPLTPGQYKDLESRINRYLRLLLLVDDPAEADLRSAAEPEYQSKSRFSCVC